MSCGEAGKKQSVYTGNQVGAYNYVGEYNYVAGGTTGLSAGQTIILFVPAPDNKRVWLRQDVSFDDQLLDAAYPTIDLQWYADIHFDDDTIFRVSDRSFYVTDKDGVPRYYDARVERAPSVNVTVGEWLAENFEVGDVALTLNNRDGFYNDYLPMGEKYRQWTGVKVMIRIGFGTKYENYMDLFEGYVTNKAGLTTTRDSIEVKAYDKFDADEIPLPPRTFSSDNFPDIDESYKGKYVPLVYGDWAEEVPTYGAVNAVCTNAFEEDPATYRFKVSDLALRSLDSVWLHRGDRKADTPQGPIRIADNLMTIDLGGGEFTIPSTGVILDEPYYIANRIKAGPGSSGGLITSDNGYNFLEQGVKIGDTIVNGAAVQSKVTLQNLEFKAQGVGSTGNGVQIQYYLLDPSFVEAYDDYYEVYRPIPGRSTNKCYATLDGGIIKVGITQYHDKTLALVTGKRTANAIKAAINANPDTAALVRVNVVGSVPFGYPAGTKPGDVNQDVPAGPVSTSGGQDAMLTATVTSVANFQLTVSGAFSFSPGTEYSISTVQYKYNKSDKITVVCQGKSLNLVSTNRLADVAPEIRLPTGLSTDFDGTYWIADDDSQKIYKLGFKSEILRTVDYSAIDAGLTQVGGIHVHSDSQIWLVAPGQSRVYRYDLELDQTSLNVHTSSITGVGALTGLSGISVKPDATVWISDSVTHEMHLIDFFSGVTPAAIRTLDTQETAAATIEPQDVSYDNQTDSLCFTDRATNAFYRVNETTGVLISKIDYADVASEISNVTAACVAQDGTLMFLDQGVLAVYNYNDMEDASNNPAVIARDILSKFGGHTYEEFDLSWMQTARQLSTYRARLVMDSKTDMVKGINKLLGQFNTVLHLRFQKYALFYIHFDNFRTTGKKVGEKDIKLDSFNPGKEMDQYFNAANANTARDPFANTTDTSDTYISTAAISFAGKEFPRTLDLPTVYRRQDVDKLVPLFVRLAAPEPEFIDVTLTFRCIRLQIHDFISLTFDESQSYDQKGRRKKSGRRFSNVPCMVRKIQYDLSAMTVGLKLWSLGNTAFGDYDPPGPNVGGEDDQIILSSVGRMGRISPVGTIVGSGTDYVDLSDVSGQNAQNRTGAGYLAWQPGYAVDLYDVATKQVVQTLTIDSVSGARVTFSEDLTTSPTSTVRDSSGIATSGHILQYATYGSLIENQKKVFASFGKPVDTYPTSRSQELEEQRGGVHNFADGGLPYILYPIAFNPSY